MPNENRSERSACSGLMYRGVPITTPGLVSACVRVSLEAPSAAAFASIRASPKSSTSGLMSRWRMPMECASAGASAACTARSTSSPMGNGPAASRAPKVGPSTYSIAR